MDAKNKANVTSAIPDWSVDEVRKALSIIRKKWNKHDSTFPINPSKEFFKDHSMEEFCFKFIMGQHMKRTQKSKSRIV